MDKRYSPGAHKLLHHLDHLKALKFGIPVAPLHVSVWPTRRCQCNCSYCCCRNDEAGEELNYEDFINVVDVLKRHGTKAIEFSGGGEPLLWKDLEKTVTYISNRGIEISLITNGLALSKMSKDCLSCFSWIRVSLQSLEHAQKINFDVPTRISASYIVQNPLDIAELPELHAYLKEKNIVTRIAVAHPTTVEDVQRAKLAVAHLKSDLFFFAEKEAGTPLGCYGAWIRAAIDWRGNVLPCPSTQLLEEANGKILDKFILCHMNNLEQWIWDTVVHDLGFRCAFCNCGKENNDLIHQLLQKVEDVNFV